MAVLRHDPHNPKIVPTAAGEQMAMQVHDPSVSSVCVLSVQLHLWHPDPTPNTVPPIAKTQPRSDDNENAQNVHPSGGTS